MTSDAQMTKKPKPAFETRLGDIKGTVWVNDNEEDGRQYYNYTVLRSYKDEKTGDFKETPSMRVQDRKLVNIANDEIGDFLDANPLNQ